MLKKNKKKGLIIYLGTVKSTDGGISCSRFCKKDTESVRGWSLLV